MQADEGEIFRCMEQNSFAALVSNGDEGLSVSHLPMLVDRENRKLIGHMARANRHWQAASGQQVLCIFNGPHSYISPRWYEEENVVPTWNYIVVHVRGVLNVTEDEAETLRALERYVEAFESPLPQPWSTHEADPDFVRRLSRQTVAFEVGIQQLDGIWKLSQHHPPQRNSRVVAALEQQSGENAQAVAEHMRPFTE